MIFTELQLNQAMNPEVPPGATMCVHQCSSFSCGNGVMLRLAGHLVSEFSDDRDGEVAHDEDVFITEMYLSPLAYEQMAYVVLESYKQKYAKLGTKRKWWQR